jgi:hypothetical protein
MLCRRLSQYPRTQQPSTYYYYYYYYYYWNLGWHDPPASYIEVWYCDLLVNQTDLHLVSFFPHCVFLLFLKSASQIGQLVLLITSWHGPCIKHCSSVSVQLLLSDSMMYSIVACAAIGMDCAENTVSLSLFTGCCLVTAGCYNSKILALSEYATVLIRVYHPQKVKVLTPMSEDSLMSVDNFSCLHHPSLHLNVGLSSH